MIIPCSYNYGGKRTITLKYIGHFFLEMARIFLFGEAVTGESLTVFLVF